MNEIFVDTSGWVALKHKEDALFEAASVANTALLEFGVRYTTTNFVLDECYTLLMKHAGHHVAVEFGEEISNSRLVTVIHITQEIELESWKMFARSSDKQYSFTDCTSFLLMRQRNVWEAFTNDHHFEQAGFHRLLKPTKSRKP